MAEIEKPTSSSPQPELQTQRSAKPDKSSTSMQKPPFHQIYALPVPIRTFPLPSFYPNNPLSLFHVLWAWASQVVSPPPTEPSPVHVGLWSSETRSVHVRDPKSIRALWEQGFFGKGNYSRSEPNWLKREQVRQGQGDKIVSEQATVQRREERKMMKWERARKEQEAILRTRLQEAWIAPVGPIELLALPNCAQDLRLALSTEFSNEQAALNESAAITIASSRVSPDIAPTPLKRRKSVRFSPNVESTTFKLSDPPSPHLGSLANGKTPNGVLTNGTPSLPQPVDTIPVDNLDRYVTAESLDAASEVVDREHLQLSPEEAFYLVFAIGALSVTDSATGITMPAEDLLQLFCRLPYFPSSATALPPDNPFLVQYAVYHHFRSLGWVPRSGIKFGVDWLLYFGGPVFAHAEFAVVVLPAYTDDYWKTQKHKSPQRSWHWLHSINRVQSHALKTLVLVYVDIPRPTQGLDLLTLLKRYKIREFFMKRWISNRNRGKS
ncbi:hypothetical protein F5Y19DRAFT_467021 [Xylariaceae sp. FL1651]|nr:hypothetical protein F5Y19DRAFT_467021 [Xylariaceae sp. FL1651]